MLVIPNVPVRDLRGGAGREEETLHAYVQGDDHFQFDAERRRIAK
jgi:hypothetical protein